MRRLELCSFMASFAFVVYACATQSAHADPLPWLAEKISDPFASTQKASGLVATTLKPDSCNRNLDLSHPLKFNEVVIASLCNNPDTRAAYLSLVSQAASTAANYSAYFPMASANYSLGRTTTFAEDSRITSTEHGYGLSLGMTLYDFGQREFKIETAELALTAAGHSYNYTLQEAIASALTGYYGLLTAQNALAVANDSESFAKASYEAAALRHKIGQVPLADELTAKGSYSQSQLSTEAAQNSLAQQQASLALLMGLAADVPLQMSEVDDKTLAQDPFGGKVQALMQNALHTRHDLLSTKDSLKSSEASFEALKRADLATVSATTTIGASNNVLNVLGRTATRTQGVGLNVNIPIFTGFNQTYSEKAAEKSLEAQREGVVKTELSVQQDVWNAWHNYETAKLSWETSKDQMISATQLKEVALGRYKEGLGSILDVLNAQSQYSAALQSQLQTRYSLLTSRVDLVRSVGVLDLDSMQPDRAVAAFSLTNPPTSKR